MALRQMFNMVEIVGLLKSLSLEESTTKKGRDDIQGNATIEVTDKQGHVSNIRVNIFAFKEKKDGKINKIYKALQTVNEEYKTIDDDGRDQADSVVVSGNLDANIYVSQSGNLIESNRVRGVFFNRNKDNESSHAYAKLETIVAGMEDALNADGEPLGYHTVKAYSAGYNNSPIPLFNVIIPNGEMQEGFEEMYIPGTTGKITFQINNYAKEAEKTETESEDHGFGEDVELDNENNVDYVNNLEIIGGLKPNFDKQFEESDLKTLIKEYQQQVAEAKDNASDGFEDGGFSDGKNKSKSDEKVKQDTKDATDNLFGKDQPDEDSDGDLGEFMDI